MLETIVRKKKKISLTLDTWTQSIRWWHNLFDAIRADNTFTYIDMQYNLDDSNTDGSFTLDDSKSFWVPMKFFR